VSRTASVPALAALALAAALPACQKDLTLPIGAQLTCADGRCPDGWSCNATLRQCIRNDAIDSVAPALAAAAATPRDVRLGVTVRFAFDVTEPLLRTPVVRLDAGTVRTLAPDAAASSGLHYEFTYATAGDEPQASPCPITVDLVDRQGLLANGLSGGALRFDFSPPLISGPAVSGSPVPPAGTVQVGFTASEPPAAPPDVHLATGEPLTLVTVTGLDYVYRYTATGAEAEGVPAQVLVSLADPAGNAAVDLPAGSVRFDRTAPTLSNLVVSPSAARDGALVQVTFEASEDLGVDPVVVLSGAPASITLDRGSQSGRLYSYGHVAVPGDGSGARALSIRLVDQAGLATTVVPGVQVGFDFTAPVVSAFTACVDDGAATPCAAARSTFSAASPFDRMKVSFALSEPIAAPAVTVGATALPVGGAPDGCATADGGTTWVCRHQVVDAANGLSPRIETASVGVLAADAAGNAGSASGWVTLDFDPPALAGNAYLERCDGYAPARVGPADLWTKPVASYSGAGCPYGGWVPGPVRVHFTVSEPVALGADGVYLDDGTPLPLDPLQSTSTQLVAVLASDPAAGTRTLRAHVVDASGNAQRLVLGTLRVKLSAPARPDTTTEGRIVYHRAPNGLDATAGATRYFLAGGTSAVAAGASVVVYDGPDLASAGEIGRTSAGPSGAFGAAPGAAGAFEISAANVAEIWVAQEDAAGNSSAPTVVWDGVWYATMGGKTRGVTLGNASIFTEQPLWRTSRAATAQREPTDPTVVAVRTAAGLTTAGQPELRLLPKLAGAPSKRGGCAMTWDADRGRGLLFGGGWGVFASAPVYDDETWIWDGGSWELQAVDTRPPGRMGHGLVQDVARGKTVLFGGCQGDAACSTLLGDTWEHDGLTWRKVCWPGCTAPACTCTTTPAARRDAAMFFDHLNGRVVLFGGETAGGVQADTWTWDGADWRQLSPAASPPARSRALVDSSPYDANALLAAGWGAGGSSLADVWIWDGATWAAQPVDAALTPTGWTGWELWYDLSARKYYALLLMGERARAWTGTGWTDLAGATLTGSSTEWSRAQWGVCGAYDRDRALYVRFGGCLDYGTAECRQDYAATQATWGFASATAIRQLAPGVAPGARYGAVMAWFPALGAARLDGGKSSSRWSYLGDWVFDGEDWSGGDTATDGGKYGAAMSPIGATTLVRLAGDGYGSSGAPVHTACDTGSGFSACWGGDMASYDATDPNSVDNVTFQAMAYDPVHANAVYFRGDAGGATTWTAAWEVGHWDVTTGAPDGVVWSPRTTTSTPASVAGHQLLYCAGAGGVILFGGFDGTSYRNETWRWTGSDWQALAPATSPPARRGHVMICDEDRGKLYVVGGQNASGHLADVWEYDGATWRQRTPIEAPSARREAVAAWLPAAGRGVVFSGWDGAEYLGDTWLWNGGRYDRPAHVFRAAFGAAGVWGQALVRGVDLTWYAGGTAASGGSGAQVQVWDRGLWRATGVANVASTTSPAALGWSTATAPEWSGYGQAVLADRVKRLFAGDARELTFAVTPVGTNGTSTTLAAIRTGYVQAAVRYRLSCRAAGAAARDPALCCSASASSGRCL
jgi:hypothetical protein